MVKTPFIVAAVSENANSFGLFSVIMIARCGTAFQILQNSLNKLNYGSVRHINTILNNEGKVLSYNFSSSLIGAECETQLPNAPEDIIKLVWN